MLSAPKFVKIGVITWKVQFIKLESPEWGLCEPATRTISIDKDMDLTAQQSTLIHECLHALWVCYGWPESGKVEEEAVVSQMEMPVLMLLRDNPDLLAWLLQ